MSPGTDYGNGDGRGWSGVTAGPAARYNSSMITEVGACSSSRTALPMQNGAIPATAIRTVTE